MLRKAVLKLGSFINWIILHIFRNENNVMIKNVEEILALFEPTIYTGKIDNYESELYELPVRIEITGNNINIQMGQRNTGI
jgi:hypothetical protein